MKILVLTRSSNGKSIRVNFSHAVHYYRTSHDNTVITFVGGGAENSNSMRVKETPEEIDDLLGI